MNKDYDKIYTTVGLNEKWIGAMITPNKKSYMGAIRLDFSSKCKYDKAINAVIETLSRHSILSARFELEEDELVGYVPNYNTIKKYLTYELKNDDNNMSDEIFLSFEFKDLSERGLRVAKKSDTFGLHIWIGFWIFTCDGISIDLIINQISERYKGKIIDKDIGNEVNDWNNYVKRQNLIKYTLEDMKKFKKIYEYQGPYGMDALNKKQHNQDHTMGSILVNFGLEKNILKEYSKKNRVTEFTILFALFQKAISEITGRKNIITGVPFSNRHILEDYNIVGPISNTVPVLTIHKNNDKIQEIIKNAQYALLEASKRQSIKSSLLYPEGITAQNCEYELPYPQLFNSWNSQQSSKTINLSLNNNNEWVKLFLLPNNTCRVGFEMTLNTADKYISGRIDMNENLYRKYTYEIIEIIKKDLIFLI